MTFELRNMFIIILIALASQLLSAQSAMTGSMRGIVWDNEKVALPGVLIILSETSASLKKSAHYSDANGKFEFKDLAPGMYRLTAELSGLETVSIKEIAIQPGGIINLEITLRFKLSTSKTITVLPEIPLLNPKVTVPPQEILQKEFLDAPLRANEFQEILPLIPSVVRGPDGQINMNGARASENSLLVNGSNVTDPVTGEFAMDIPIEAIENIQTFTNSYSAEYGKYTGGLVNIATLPGDNKWRFNFNAFVPRLRLHRYSVAGISAFTPHLIISGPIIPSKLFFSQSFNVNFIRTTLGDLKVFDNETKYTNYNSLTQLDYHINPHKWLTFTLSFFPQTTTNMGLNQFHPPESCPIQEQFGWNVGIYFKNISDKGALSETIMSVKKFDSKIIPDFDTPMFITPEQLQGNYFNRQIRSSYRYVFLHSHTFPLYQFKGDHIIKAGAEINYTSYSGTNESYPVFVLREDSSLSRQITFTGSTHIGQHTTELTLFAQDSWSINKKLTVDLGARLDKNYLISGYYMQPRIAFVYTPFKSKTTIIRGGIGTFYDKFLLNVPDFLRSQIRTEQYYSENGESYSLRYVPLIKNDLKLPRSITGNAEIDQQLLKNLILRVNYMYRKGSDELIVNPEIVSSQEAYFILSNNGHSLYRALETTLRYDFKNSFIVFSYIRSKAEGDLNSFSQIYGYLEEPIIRKDYYSLLPTDHPNRILFWGVFRLPKGITFSPLLEYHTGFPYSAVDENQNYTGEINGYRFRDFVQLDIRLTKSIKFKKYTFQAGIKILNVLNHFNPRDVNNNIDSPFFGYSYNQVKQRTLRIVFEILY